DHVIKAGSHSLYPFELAGFETGGIKSIMSPVDELAVGGDGEECRDDRLLPVLCEIIHGVIDRLLDPIPRVGFRGQRRDFPSCFEVGSTADTLRRAAGVAAEHRPIME